MSERMNQLLAGLPAADPDLARAERIRRRCRARLSSTRPPRRPWSARALGAGTARLWQPLIASLAVAYLTEVVRQALR